MKILKYKKKSRGRYKLTTDTSELVLYEDVILKNNLLYNKDITLEVLEKIMNENIYYEAYDLSLSFIEKKLRTKKEVINYLEGKGFNKRVIDETIKKLESVNLLNVRAYVEAYVNDKVNLGNSGPYKIKKELVNLGIDEEEINEYLNTISEDIWLSKLDKIVDKKMLSLKNKSLFMIKNKLNMDLAIMGYDKDMINEVLSKLTKNDGEAMKKEMEKAYNKYSKKYEGDALKWQIKNHLYRKGYIVSDIEL